VLTGNKFVDADRHFVGIEDVASFDPHTDAVDFADFVVTNERCGL